VLRHIIDVMLRLAKVERQAMRVDNERWKGVPVMVKCGKGKKEVNVKILADAWDSAGQGIDGNDVPPSPAGA
jgi:hypothetical protein